MIGHLDCSTGVSGDKFLGALLDVAAASGVAFGAPELQAILDELAPEARVTVTERRSYSIAARGVEVSAASQPAHRHWRDLRMTLGQATLPAPVASAALDVFGALAQAEARAHGCDIDDVHFHEVGAIDSILDIVGVCAGLHALGIESLTMSPVATGSGTVHTSHGILPVPAPATAFLLEGVAVVPGARGADGGDIGELTTPTGAALVRKLAASTGPLPAMTVRATGFGAGTRDIGMPNVCALTVGEPAVPLALSERDIVVLETNIDHLSGEAIAHTVSRLLAEGALDAWTSPIVMKKGRPAVVLSLISSAADAPHFAQRMVALTGTLGVRRSEVTRWEAEREIVSVPSPWGEYRVKVGPAGADHRIRPEADDVARIASEIGEPFAQVHSELSERARLHLEEQGR